MYTSALIYIVFHFQKKNRYMNWTHKVQKRKLQSYKNIMSLSSSKNTLYHNSIGFSQIYNLATRVPYHLWEFIILWVLGNIFSLFSHVCTFKTLIWELQGTWHVMLNIRFVLVNGNYRLEKNITKLHRCAINVDCTFQVPKNMWSNGVFDNVILSAWYIVTWKLRPKISHTSCIWEI